MKRILIALGLAILGTASAFAQSVGMPSVGGYWSTTACGTGPSPCFVQYGSSVPTGGNVAAGATDSGNPVKVGGVYNVTAPTYTTGQRGDVQQTARGETIVRLSASGALISAGNPSDGLTNGIQVHQFNGMGSVYNGSTWDRQRGDTTGTYVVGNGAAAAADSGNPVKVGGIFNTTAPTVTDGQRANAAFGSTGSLRTQLCNTNDGGSTNCTQLGADNLDGGSSTSSAQRPIGLSRIQNFNGASWDRQFTCTSSAVVNVTAAATTQIVALSASTVIRVCSFTITGSAAGTAATWVYGTGANCGTGTTSLTGAMLMPANGPISATGMNGSLFRGAAANALCLTAATGNVTGFVTYAQY